MSKFSIKSAILTFSQLGHYLLNPGDELIAIISAEHHYNAWFTTKNVLKAVKAIGKTLNEDDLRAWIDQYKIEDNPAAKKVGLILAGNIPLVGFHDVLCVLITGNHALIKASTQDSHLIKHLLNKLVSIDASFKNRFTFVERLTDFDSIIATGSNNTSRYFEYYFSKVPHIIRKNRNSLALLAGNETEGQLHALGHDIFDYYGLGCRNVSKLLVPKDYNFTFFFESIQPYHTISDHHKYNNNYDYNKSIYLVNGDKHLDNGFLLVKEDERWVSPLAVLYFQYYDNLQTAEQTIIAEQDKLQCVVTNSPITVKTQVVDFGKSQQPGLSDYADGVDTMAFLIKL